MPCAGKCHRFPQRTWLTCSSRNSLGCRVGSVLSAGWKAFACGCEAPAGAARGFGRLTHGRPRGGGGRWPRGRAVRSLGVGELRHVAGGRRIVCENVETRARRGWGRGGAVLALLGRSADTHPRRTAGETARGLASVATARGRGRPSSLVRRTVHAPTREPTGEVTRLRPAPRASRTARGLLLPAPPRPPGLPAQCEGTVAPPATSRFPPPPSPHDWERPCSAWATGRPACPQDFLYSGTLVTPKGPSSPSGDPACLEHDDCEEP